MKKKIFGIIIDSERLKIYSKNLKFYLKNYREIIPDEIETYLIDISHLHIIKKDLIDIDTTQISFKLFRPKNFQELYSFSKKNEIIATIKIKETFLNLRLNFLINLICKKKIIINNMGFYVMSNKISQYKINEKLNFIFNVKLNYFIYRILSILNFVKKTDVLITSSGSNLNKFQQGISYKLKKLTKIDFSYIKKSYKVNSYFDDISNKNEIEEKYIVFCDSGFDHKDRILRDGKIKIIDRENYYKSLHEFLKNLSNKFNKEVIFCLHPKAEYPPSNNFDKIKKDFKCIKFETEQYIKKSYLCLFISSLSINIAILLKKNIIIINSNFLGNFYNLRNEVLSEEIKLFNVNIDDDAYKKFSVNKFKTEFENYLNNYNEFIKKNIISDYRISYAEQIKKILKKECFFNDSY